MSTVHARESRNFLSLCICVLALNYGNEFINNNNNDEAIQALPEEMNVKSHSGSHEHSAHAYCH